MRKNIFLVLIIGLFLSLINLQPVQAAAVAGQSATLNYTSSGFGSLNIIKNDLSETNRYLAIKLAIKKVLEDNDSPMKDEVDSFVAACYQYQIDCFLLPAIAGLESTYGKFLLPKSHNAWGWGGGQIYFSNWKEAIFTIAKALRENYVNKGAASIEQIAPIYSESNTWSTRVNLIRSYFEAEAEKKALFLVEE